MSKGSRSIMIMCIISFYPFFHLLLFRFISHTVDVSLYTLHTYKIGYIPFICSVDTYSTERWRLAVILCY